MNRNVCFFIYFIFLVLTARDIFSKWNESLEKATKGRGGAGASPDGAVVGGVNAEPQEDLLDDELGAPKKSIPSMSFQSTGDPSSTPTIKITYCYSCGYAKAFEEYSKMLMSRFPTINVIGGHHNPGFLRSALSQILSYGKLTLIFVLVVGIDPFVMAGQPAPRVWTWMKEHKVSFLFKKLNLYFIAFLLDKRVHDSVLPDQHL